MDETRRLAQFVADATFQDLPVEVVEATRTYILDNIASAMVGSVTPWAAMVEELAKQSAPQGPCSVIGRDWSSSPSLAALVNGTMVGGFETDHAFIPGSCHPSAAVFPAVLAIAERDHLDGKSFLLAHALGYEVLCRVGLAATRAVEDEAGFHGPGTNAAFGGASGAGKALGLDAAGLGNALGVAGSHGGGLLEFVAEGAMTKRTHVGRGCQLGLESALLASMGFTGPSTVLEGDRGFLRVYSPSPRPELLVDGLGERYVMLGMTIKAYACHASFHPVVDVVRRFREQEQWRPADVGGVKVAGTERMIVRHGQLEPTSILGAQYSLPFSVAVALSRDVSDPLVYSEETLRDPGIRTLAQSVELSVDGERFGTPGEPVAEVTLEIGGRPATLEATTWKGAPADPCGYVDAADKLRRYAACVDRYRISHGEGKWAASRVEAIIEKVATLERLPDVADLAKELRSGGAG